MARRTLTRPQRLLRDVLILLLSLLLLYAALGFPIPTAEAALRALEERQFFSGAQVVGQVQREEDRSYALRRGDWYARADLHCRLILGLPFWEPGQFRAAPVRPGVPLTPVPEEERSFFSQPQEVWVFSDDPAIASVTLEIPARLSPTMVRMYTFSQGEKAFGNCFILTCYPPNMSSYSYPQDFRLSGYDREGELVWQSPLPEEWVEDLYVSPGTGDVLFQDPTRVP